MKFDVAFPLLMDQCILICMTIWFLPGKSYNNVSTFQHLLYFVIKESAAEWWQTEKKKKSVKSSTQLD